MTKTYLLNQELNNAVFTIAGEKGNQMQFAFRGGNVVTHTPAYCILSNEYCQQLLENSDIFKQGRVKFDPETAKAVRLEEELNKIKEENERNAAIIQQNEASEHYTTEELEIVGDVKTVTQAQNYVAEHFGELAKTALDAKRIANENGVDFPNLRIGKGRTATV